MPSSERWVSKFKIKPYSWVFIPNKETIQNGINVKKSLEAKWTPPLFYYHLRSGGHVKALKSHVKNNFFIHLDIQNFFSSINRSRVTRNLKVFYSYTDARNIAMDSTVRLPESIDKKYILPFGFVQSPLIASLCLQQSRLGNYLKELYSKKGISVSVYMDDIIISGNNLTNLTLILKKIKLVAEKSKFALNSDKEEGPAKMITAFNIELSHDLLKVSDTRFRVFFADYKMTENENKRNGILGYILSVNKEQASELK